MSASLKKFHGGGLDNFSIPWVGSLTLLAIPVGGGMVGPPPPKFCGVVKYHPTPTFLGVFIHIYV